MSANVGLIIKFQPINETNAGPDTNTSETAPPSGSEYAGRAYVDDNPALTV